MPDDPYFLAYILVLIVIYYAFIDQGDDWPYTGPGEGLDQIFYKMVKKEDKKKTVLPFDDHDEFAFITTRYITIVSIFWFPFVIYVLLFRHPIPELPHFYYVSI